MLIYWTKKFVHAGICSNPELAQVPLANVTTELISVSKNLMLTPINNNVKRSGATKLKILPEYMCI